MTLELTPGMIGRVLAIVTLALLATFGAGVMVGAAIASSDEDETTGGGEPRRLLDRDGNVVAFLPPAVVEPLHTG